jgi:hypothetical protein
MYINKLLGVYKHSICMSKHSQMHVNMRQSFNIDMPKSAHGFYLSYVHSKSLLVCFFMHIYSIFIFIFVCCRWISLNSSKSSLPCVPSLCSSVLCFFPLHTFQPSPTWPFCNSNQYVVLVVASTKAIMPQLYLC